MVTLQKLERCVKSRKAKKNPQKGSEKMKSFFKKEKKRFPNIKRVRVCDSDESTAGWRVTR